MSQVADIIRYPREFFRKNLERFDMQLSPHVLLVLSGTLDIIF